MKDLIPIDNPGPNPIFVGGMMIPPGETRLVPPDLALNHLPVAAPAPAPAAADDEDPGPDVGALEEILTGSVDDLEIELPNMTAAELVLVAELEAAGKNRVTAIEAIAAEQKRREE